MFGGSEVDRWSCVFAAVVNALVVGDCDVWFRGSVMLGEVFGELKCGSDGEVFGC